jgi:hypothetical protein
MAIYVHVSHIWNFMIESSVVYQCLKRIISFDTG